MLLLDYDGTLAPFVEQRDRAFPYPGIREMLGELIAQHRTRVVIISGRAVEDLRPLLGIDPLPEIWGSHGWERLHADGRYEGPNFTFQQKQILDSEWDWLQKHFDAARLEHKPASVALHWRGQPAETQTHMQEVLGERWNRYRTDPALDLHAFDGGLELRAAGKNKGDAVRTLLHEIMEGDVVAYCGDDATDEDAFEALEGRGLRVLVRGTPRPSHADVLCPPPDALIGFLSLWMEGD